MSMPHPSRLPIKVDSTSNGEYAPQPLPAHLEAANREARASITEVAKRLDLPRRAVLTGLTGAAATLFTLNEAFAARGRLGGRFRLPAEGPYEEAAAAEALTGSELIFDVQTHMIDPSGSWRRNSGRYWEQILARFPQGSCGEADPVDCFAAERYVDEVFMSSDTDLAVLSFVPELPENNPTSLEEANRTRTLVERLGDGRHRLLLHAMVIPNRKPQKDELERMARVAESWDIAAWKVYTQWGPEGEGWRLDDPEVGIPFIEQARALGIETICIHKGLKFPGFPVGPAACHDVGPVARRFPDVNFLIYHSGFDLAHDEGPYDPGNAEAGIDALVKSLADNDVAPNSNVYAELGSTWRLLMRDPTAAAHVLGKLLTHVGPDNLLWGTDSIWYGSPQDQIQAFRSFEIDEGLAERHGYPPLDTALKEKVFGLNGARVYGIDPKDFSKRAALDPVGRGRAARQAEPTFETYGPKTLAEWRALLASRGGFPA